MMSQQMSAIKFYMPTEKNMPCDPKTYVPTDWNSIFIPSLPSFATSEDTLTFLFQDIFELGSVKRVDIIKKENVNNRLMAFVHFNHWFDNNSTKMFREKLEKEGFADVFGYADVDEFNKNMNFNEFLGYNVNKNAFLKCMINKTPIKETDLNIHQMADILEKTDKKMDEQESLILQMKATIVEKDLQIANLMVKLETMESERIEQNEKILQFLEEQEKEKKHFCNLFVDQRIISASKNSMNELEKPKLIRNLYINDRLSSSEQSLNTQNLTPPLESNNDLEDSLYCEKSESSSLVEEFAEY